MPRRSRRLADGVDGALVIGEIARRVLGGRRRFAQHVVGEREAARLAVAALPSASSMVRPVTNCSPISRMATSTPARMIGSPPRAMSRVSAADRPCSLVVVTSLPVSTRPQVAALTNSDGLWPTWARQSPGASLSRISASRVAASGMRSSASARHISATPSWLDSEYSWIRPSTPPDRVLALSRATKAARQRLDAPGLVRARGREFNEGRHALGLGRR